MPTAPSVSTSCTVRVLPAEEWSRLATLPIAERGLPDPHYGTILVAESPEGAIVGVWGAFTVVHLDGLWVDPAYRRHTQVAARLLRGMKALLQQLGVRYSFTLIESPAVLALAEKAGFRRLPHDLCMLDLGENSMPVVPFIPMIAQGVGAVVGGIAAKKAQKGAMKRSPEEQAALGGANTVAGQQTANAGALANQAMPYQNQAGGYYQNLLRGNRAAMTQAVAPGIASATDVYRGAERSLDKSGVRGAARDVASGDLARSRASQIAGLTTGVQPWAAGQLGGLGNQMMGQANQAYGQSGTIYANLLGQGFNNRKNAMEEGSKTGAAIGGMVRDIGEAWPGAKKGGGGLTPKGQSPVGPYSGGYQWPVEPGLGRGPMME